MTRLKDDVLSVVVIVVLECLVVLDPICEVVDISQCSCCDGSLILMNMASLIFLDTPLGSLWVILKQF